MTENPSGLTPADFRSPIGSKVARKIIAAINGVNQEEPGAGAVPSVFGRVGAVLATLGDYTASLIVNDSNIIGATVRDALNTLGETVQWLVENAGGGPGGSSSTSGVLNDTELPGTTLADVLVYLRSKRIVESPLNKRMMAQATTADGQVAIAVSLLATPIPGGYVGVRFNGLDLPQLGDGTKVGAYGYFSRDGGSTALALLELQVGDQFYWQGSIAGFELSPTDVFDFMFQQEVSVDV